MVVNGCCCMNLRTGGLVLGWLGLVASIITISCKINRLTQFELYENQNQTIQIDDDGYYEEKRQRSFVADVILLSISILNAIVTAMLINGIMSNKHRFLLPWLIVKGASLIVVIPLGFLILAGAALSSDPNHIVASVVSFLIIGFCAWCWLTIYSLHKEMRATASKQLTYFESVAKNGETVPYQLFEKY